MFRLEFSNKAWVPQLTGDPEILAASHHRIGFAAFRRGRNAVWGEIILLATGNGYQPIQAN